MRRVSLMFALALAATLSLGSGDSDPPAGHASHAEKPAKSAEQTAKAEANPVDVQSPSTDQTPVAQALVKPIDFDFVKTPLKDVAAVIAKKSGINVILDEKAITDAGGAADMPITRATRGLWLKRSLRLILADHELDFLEVDDNVLQITTASAARESITVRTYDAHDLAASDKNSDSDGRLKEIIDMIVAVVAPTTWTENGGTGAITTFEDQLIVSQTREVHEQIVDLLTSLRQARDEPDRYRTGGGVHPLSDVELKQELDSAEKLSKKDKGWPKPLSEKEIRALFQSRHDFDYHEVRLKDVQENLWKLGLPVELDAKAISDAGGAPDMPITFNAKNVRLGTALKLMLAPHELNYIIDNEFLILTTNTAANEHTETRLYAISDLLPEMSAGSAHEASAYEELMAIIVGTVSPASWDAAGGIGSIRPFPQLKILVCNQTQDAHQEIGKMLSMLRSNRHPLATSTGNDARPKEDLVTRVYHLSLNDSDAVAEYLNVVERLVEPKLWNKGENYLGKVPGAIIARCSPAVHSKIRELLVQLDALPPQPGKGGAGRLSGGLGGGGFGGGGGGGGGFSGGGAF